MNWPLIHTVPPGNQATKGPSARPWRNSQIYRLSFPPGRNSTYCARWPSLLRHHATCPGLDCLLSNDIPSGQKRGPEGRQAITSRQTIASREGRRQRMGFGLSCKHRQVAAPGQVPSRFRDRPKRAWAWPTVISPDGAPSSPPKPPLVSSRVVEFPRARRHASDANQNSSHSFLSVPALAFREPPRSGTTLASLLQDPRLR